ncbi:MAG: translation initiation factor IF-3 [Dehalococcoidia bacterium]
MSILRCNEQIRLSPVRLIDNTGEQRGIISTAEALDLAREVGMDLVEVSPNERPPVCKIMDYGKHKYLQSKKQKQKHHEQRLKEVRIRPKTDPHDKDIKLGRARSFLSHGDRVQFTMLFRGRERFHKEVGLKIFNGIVASLEDVAKIERPARALGRRMTMVLVPTKLSSPQKAKTPKAPKTAKAAATSPPDLRTPAKKTAPTPAGGVAPSGLEPSGLLTPESTAPPPEAAAGDGSTQ